MCRCSGVSMDLMLGRIRASFDGPNWTEQDSGGQRTLPSPEELVVSMELLPLEPVGFHTFHLVFTSFSPRFHLVFTSFSPSSNPQFTHDRSPSSFRSADPESTVVSQGAAARAAVGRRFLELLGHSCEVFRNEPREPPSATSFFTGADAIVGA